MAKYVLTKSSAVEGEPGIFEIWFEIDGRARSYQTVSLKVSGSWHARIAYDALRQSFVMRSVRP